MIHQTVLIYRMGCQVCFDSVISIRRFMPVIQGLQVIERVWLYEKHIE